MGRSKKGRGYGRIRQQQGVMNMTKAQARRILARSDPDLANLRKEDGIQMRYVCGDEDDAVGFVYSFNHGGRPEFYVPNVPQAKLQHVMRTINGFAKDDTLGHRHSLRGDGELLFWLNLVEGDKKKRLLATTCLYMNHFESSVNAPLYELRPRFECSPNDSWWGCREPAPDGMEEMTDDILRTWETQGQFRMCCSLGPEAMAAASIVFKGLDSDSIDELFPKYKSVDLTCALRHIDEWKVDWNKNLTDEQVQYVREHTKYFRGLTKVLFRDKPICEYCGEVEGLTRCSGCHSSMYCSKECQVADWKDHKKKCKHIKAMRNGN